MGMYINSATSSMALTRSLYQTSVMQTNIMKRLSSGIRINSASDDAAGLSLSQKLTSVINGNTVAKNNAQTGISFLNTADGALSVMTNSLERIRNLAVQAANGVYSSSERQMLQNEVQKLTAEIKQGYQSAKFSDKNVFGAQETAIAETPQLSEAQAVAAGYNDAHIIRSATDFESKVVNHESESFILVNDLDFSAIDMSQGHISWNDFSGSLDGNEHAIKNLTINGASGDMQGLFFTVSGTVKNLSLDNVSINAASGSGMLGALTGWSNSGATISNVRSSGSIKTADADYIGGIIGYNDGGTISNCSSSVNLNLTGTGNAMGGLLGLNNGNVSNCSSSGTISGIQTVGGLIGYMTSGTIQSSSSSAQVNGDSNVGGLIGDTDGGNVLNCSASGNVYAASSGAGGMVGANDGGTYDSCYATGSTSSNYGSGGAVGGFSGFNFNGSITNSYSTGSVSGNWMLGGFTGHNSGTITSSYTTSNVNGSDPSSTGGFSGNPDASSSSDPSDFYKNNMSVDMGNVTAVNGNTSQLPISSWDSKVWDTSAATPALKNVARAFGTATTLIGLQIGDDSNTRSKIDLNTAFGLGSLDFSMSDKTSALSTITQAEQMMTFLNAMRSTVGSSINKLSSVINIQDSRILNLSASKSTINDSDMAIESANLVKDQIRNQAATTLMAQTKNLDKNLLMSLLG